MKDDGQFRKCINEAKAFFYRIDKEYDLDHFDVLNAVSKGYNEYHELDDEFRFEPEDEEIEFESDLESGEEEGR